MVSDNGNFGLRLKEYHCIVSPHFVFHKAQLTCTGVLLRAWTGSVHRKGCLIFVAMNPDFAHSIRMIVLDELCTFIMHLTLLNQ